MIDTNPDYQSFLKDFNIPQYQISPDSNFAIYNPSIFPFDETASMESTIPSFNLEDINKQFDANKIQEEYYRLKLLEQIQKEEKEKEDTSAEVGVSTPEITTTIQVEEPVQVSYSSNTNQTATSYVNYLMTKHKLSKTIACGIVANLMIESSLNPQAKGDDGTAFGLAQWRADRLQNLMTFSNNNPTIDKQLDFIIHELKNGPDAGAKNAWTKMQTAKTASEIAKIFMKFYERPHKDPNVNHIAKREQYANQYFNNIA